jgi:hypothetical protein
VSAPANLSKPYIATAVLEEPTPREMRERQERALAGLSKAQQRWRLETGARLVGLEYTRDHLPPPARTGETVSEKPVCDEGNPGLVVGRLLIREYPDGTRSETPYDLEGRAS